MVCEYWETLGVMPLMQTHDQSSVLESQVFDEVDLELLICEQRIGQEAVCPVHQASRVARGTELGSTVWVLARAARREMATKERILVVLN